MPDCESGGVEVNVKKEIAVIFGGQSSEHEVSCKSVMNVLNHMDTDKYNIHRIGITKEGRWLFVKDSKSIEDGSWREGTVQAIISPDSQDHGMLLIAEDSCRCVHIDVAYPVLHGLMGEDGTIQGLFELSGIPYVGCGVLSSSVSMDKISTKIFVDRLGIRQAKYVVDIERDTRNIEDTMNQVEETLGYPVFVKPSNAGSSQGVSKAQNRDELAEAIALAKQHDHRVLIEENIVGREIECAVLGGDDPKASRIGEVLAAAEFYDFDAKYNNDESRTIVDPQMPEQVKEEVREDAVKVFKAVSGYGLSRVDFFVEKDTNQVVFNEINTLPGFTSISMYPMLWEDMGLSKSELIDAIIETAYTR